MTDIDLSGFAKRNIWPLQSGEMAVRPGIRKIDDLVSDDVVAAFSIKTFTNQETQHFIFHEQTAPYKLFLTVYDEDFDGLPLQTLLTDATSRPEVITHAVVFDQIVIASPDFSTLFGYTGGTIMKAEKPSALTTNTTLDPVDVPRGICTSWGGRCVIADGTMVYFSELVRFGLGVGIGFNVFSGSPVPGNVYGIHTNAGGDLVVVTNNGVFGLPVDYSSAGDQVAPSWNKWNDHVATGYGQTCASRGEVFALTRRGFRGLTGEGNAEVFLDEPRVQTTVTTRIAHDNYMMGYIYGGVDGPVIAHPDGDGICFVDLSVGMHSWWTMTHSGETQELRGLLIDPYGEQLLVTKKAAYAVGGNFDGDIASTSENATAVYGAYIGSMPASPDRSPKLRRVDYTTDSNGNVKVSFLGLQRTVANTPQKALETFDDATSEWDLTETTAKKLLSVRTRWAERTDDLGMEIAVEGCLSRMPPVLSVEFRGPGGRRP